MMVRQSLKLEDREQFEKLVIDAYKAKLQALSVHSDERWDLCLKFMQQSQQLYQQAQEMVDVGLVDLHELQPIDKHSYEVDRDSIGLYVKEYANYLEKCE